MRHYSHRARLAALETDVNSKYLCLSALAALLDAAEHAHKTSFVKGTLAISFKPVEGVMLLDPATVGARAPLATTAAPQYPLLTLSLASECTCVRRCHLLLILHHTEPRMGLGVLRALQPISSCCAICALAVLSSASLGPSTIASPRRYMIGNRMV